MRNLTHFYLKPPFLFERSGIKWSIYRTEIWNFWFCVTLSQEYGYHQNVIVMSCFKGSRRSVNHLTLNSFSSSNLQHWSATCNVQISPFAHYPVHKYTNWICMCCSWSFISINFQVFLGMVVYANKFKTKEKEKLIEIKN